MYEHFMFKIDMFFQFISNTMNRNMKSAFFCLFTVIYICQADLTLEENARKKDYIPHNISDWMTKDLLDLEYSTIKQVETITYPLLDEIRHSAEVARQAGKDPSDCIHVSTKFLLSSVDDFYHELDLCNVNAIEINNMENASSCNQKVLSAFGSIANGAREYFKICIASIPDKSP